MSVFAKTGQQAVNAAQQTEGGDILVSFKSGSTFKVGVADPFHVAEFYSYGIYKKVNSFVPEVQPVRNSRGFVESGHTPWDRASEYFYKQAKEAEEAGASESEVKALRDQGNLYRGKQRFMRVFYDLTKGSFIAVDISPAQERVISNAINESIDDLNDIAFKLSKKGTGQSTTVTLTPIINMKRDLTDEERANFERMADAEFSFDMLDGALYVADEAEQIKLLEQAGFDLSLIDVESSSDSGDDGGTEEDVF